MIILAAYIWAIIMGQISKKHNKEFEEFLNDNIQSILNGHGCIYNGTVYTKDTKIIRYRYCVSVLIMTFTRTTYYEPADSDIKIFCSSFLITFFTGLWGIPWGPIKTVDSFIKNIRKEDEISIEELYNSRSQAKNLKIQCPKCGRVSTVDSCMDTFYCGGCGCGYKIIRKVHDPLQPGIISIMPLESENNYSEGSSFIHQTRRDAPLNISGKTVAVICLVTFVVISLLFFILNT